MSFDADLFDDVTSSSASPGGVENESGGGGGSGDGQFSLSLADEVFSSSASASVSSGGSGGGSGGRGGHHGKGSAFDEHELFGDAAEDGGEALIDARYDEEPWLRWEEEKKKILLLSAIPMLLAPLATTTLNPVLPQIAEDLDTSYTLATLTITGFNLFAGIFPMFFGPLSDRFGRKMIFYINLPMYALMSCLSGIAPNIWILIACRAVMGGFACASAVAGAGYIGDMFPPSQHAKPLGAQQLPALIAPLLGPLIGGFLATWLGWRSINFFLALVVIPIAILLYVFIPDTLPKESSRQMTAKALLSALNPLNTLSLLFCKPIITCIALGRSVGYSAMIMMALITPAILTNRYDLNDMEVGLWFLPFGIATIVGSVAGGVLGDVGVKLGGKGGRLVPAVACTIVLAVGCVGFGWTIEWNMWVAMLFSVLIAFVTTATRPSFLAYAMGEVKTKSSGVTGAVMMASSCLSLVFSLLTEPASDLVGVAAVFSFMACLMLLCILPTTVIMAVNTEKQQENKE